MQYTTIETNVGKPIKAWVNDVPFDPAAQQQLKNISSLPFIHQHVAVMPDVHLGKGATIGSVIPTLGAVIPAAVGVDLGCGMQAVKTSLKAAQLPDNLYGLRCAFEKAVPHGRTGGKRGARDKGAWHDIPEQVGKQWGVLEPQFKAICEKHPLIEKSNHVKHLGTMGTGNHFLELCLDENQDVWLMLHSGSRGVGNRIGNYFIELAKKDMVRLDRQLPDQDLAYLSEGTDYFDDYVEAVEWAQNYARMNREIMMQNALFAMRDTLGIPFTVDEMAVNCHHNYISREHHFGEDVILTRKGAVSAKKGELGIIPGSMGARSYIVRGKGNADSFCSCSHGAGRVMSRTKAKKAFTVEDQVAATQGVECRKDKDVIDEIPQAYKDIDKVIAAQSDLIEVVHTLKQIVCVKG